MCRPSREQRNRDAGIKESEIDQILADSFPASDAPPWTLGVTFGGPAGIRHEHDDRSDCGEEPV